MTKDLNKNISSIQYNLLNLPQKVTFKNGNTVSYTYDATGRKTGASYGFVTTGVTYAYCDNFHYENGTLKEILIDGGYITFNGSTPVYHYYLKDHLGNNRVVMNKTGAVEQVNHYYPYGSLFGESTGNDAQRYKYNSKEFDRTHGLDWLDYGARYMSPDVARFTTMDPMAEKYYHLSPYAYCGNNPINNVDPSGMDWIYANYNGEQFVYFDDRVKSQDDINRFYYSSDKTLSVKYFGKSGSVYQGTEDGKVLFCNLNSDGTYSDSEGNLLSQEVSVGGKMHIGSSLVQENKQDKKNLYGIYLGANNPKDNNGDYLYAIPPIDMLDYAAYRHDKGYDSKNVAGPTGVFLNSSNYGDDWNLSVRALNEVLTSKIGTSKWFWALGTSAAFGPLAILKKINELRK